MAKKPRTLKVPRLQGLTELAKAYNLMPDDQLKQKILIRINDKILGNYIQQGFTVMGIPTSIPELCTMFGLSMRQVMDAITRTSKALGQLTGDTESLQATYQALLAITIEGTMAVSGAGRLQTQQLQRAKGQRLWVQGLDRDLSASISGESRLQANNLMLLKHLAGRDGGTAPTIDITNNNLVQNQADQGKYFGADEAVMLISKQGTLPLLEAADDITDLQSLHPHITEGPVIIATKQTGMKDDGTFASHAGNKPPTNHELGRNEDNIKER